MTDWRKLYEQGCCPDNRGCNVCRNCMCALAEDVIEQNAELLAALEAITEIDYSLLNAQELARAAITKAKRET